MTVKQCTNRNACSRGSSADSEEKKEERESRRAEIRRLDGADLIKSGLISLISSRRD